MIEISLIVATCGRQKELEALLASLMCQETPQENFEVIVVDQNDETLDLNPLMTAYSGSLQIQYYRSSLRNLSASRNIGLKHAVGRYVAFPDDDCLYYPDTLRKVLDYFQAHSKVDMLLGAIIDRSNGKSLLREWPRTSRVVTKWNCYRLISSITLFCKNSDRRFDDILGAGAPYGSNEDIDFVFRWLGEHGRACYEPSIDVWHPTQPIGTISASKVKQYGRGFGAFAVKNCSLHTMLLFAQALIFHTLLAMMELFRGRTKNASLRWIALMSRVMGAIQYMRTTVNGPSHCTKENQ